MKKLILAIDCDDVLVAATEYVVSTYNKEYGTNVLVDHAFMFANPEWEAERGEVFKRLHLIQQTKEYGALVPSDTTVTAIHRLAKEHELHLVTSRSSEVERVTQKMVTTYFKNCFTTIEHVGPDSSKGDVCQKINADALIDDNAKHIEDADRHGIKCNIWFGDYPWQQNIPDAPHVRCKDWKQIMGYFNE